MSGIYGDILLAWPEQMQSFNLYGMSPKINGGWNITAGSQRTIRGVYQNTRGGQLKDSNGNLVCSDGGEIWTAAKDADGLFINMNGKVYRLNASNSWSREGGFRRYGLEQVVGNNGTEHDISTWNTGSNSFG